MTTKPRLRVFHNGGKKEQNTHTHIHTHTLNRTLPQKQSIFSMTESQLKLKPNCCIPTNNNFIFQRNNIDKQLRLMCHFTKNLSLLKVTTTNFLLVQLLLHSLFGNIIVFVWLEQILRQQDKSLLWRKRNMFGARLKTIWEEQLVDPPIDYVTVDSDLCIYVLS